MRRDCYRQLMKLLLLGDSTHHSLYQVRAFERYVPPHAGYGSRHDSLRHRNSIPCQVGVVLPVFVEFESPEQTEIYHGRNKIGTGDASHGEKDLLVVPREPHRLEVLKYQVYSTDHQNQCKSFLL